MPVQSTRGPLETDDIPCWDCNGDGLVVSPEAVERLGVVIQDMWVDTPAADEGLSRSIAEAGLRAALGIEKT